MVQLITGDRGATAVEHGLQGDVLLAQKPLEGLVGAGHQIAHAVGALAAGAGQGVLAAQADHGHALVLGNGEGAVVLQQHAAALGHLQHGLVVLLLDGQHSGSAVGIELDGLFLVVAPRLLLGLQHAVFVGIGLHQVQVPGVAQGIEDMVDGVVEDRHLLILVLDVLLDLFKAVGTQGGHFDVGALVQGEAVVSAPVGDGEALVPPQLPQHVQLEIGVGGGEGAVDGVVRRHQAQHPAVLDGGLEGGQVELVEGLLRYLDIRLGRGAGVLGKGREVLAHGDDPLALHALGLRRGQPGEEVGVLAILVLGASELRRPGDVILGAQLHVLTDGLALGAVDLAVPLHQLVVPGGRRHLAVGGVGGGPQGHDACGAVVHPHLRDAQPGGARQIAGVAVDRSGAAAAQIGRLFLNRHGVEQGLDLGIDLLVGHLEALGHVVGADQLPVAGRLLILGVVLRELGGGGLRLSGQGCGAAQQRDRHTGRQQDGCSALPCSFHVVLSPSSQFDYPFRPPQVGDLVTPSNLRAPPAFFKGCVASGTRFVATGSFYSFPLTLAVVFV